MLIDFIDAFIAFAILTTAIIAAIGFAAFRRRERDAARKDSTVASWGQPPATDDDST